MCVAQEKSKAAIRALQLFFLDSLQRGELIPLRESEVCPETVVSLLLLMPKP